MNSDVSGRENFMKKTKKDALRKTVSSKGVRLFLLVSPLLILIFIFSYVPIYGWVYSFFNYKPGLKLSQCKFVGLDNFARMFLDKYGRNDLFRILKNTLGMSLLAMSTSWLPMLFAIFLGEIKNKWYKKGVQTLTTIPNFISWVLVYAVAFSLFAVEDGFINRFLISIGAINEGINFLASSEHIWLKMWLWGTWKGLGWSAIMYIASMSSIDQQLYDAADCDGANRFQKMRYVTLPGLLPTYFVLLILSVSNFLNTGMEQYYVFQNAMNKDAIEVLDLYVYNKGMAGYDYSFATAMGMLKSLIGVVLLFGANSISRLTRKESIF